MIMLHIVIAVTSLIVSVLGVMRPSRQSVRVSYGLIVATVASGVLLAVVDQAQLLHVCMSGFTYLLFASILTFIMRHRVEKSIENIVQ